eukprot:2666128-Heterocapsa_arctica.AAC.1
MRMFPPVPLPTPRLVGVSPKILASTGSDRNASEKKQMNYLAAAANNALREQQGPYGTAEQADDAHSGGWKRAKKSKTKKDKNAARHEKLVAELE